MCSTDVEIDMSLTRRWIAIDGVRHYLHEFTAFYLRPYDFRQFPDFADVAPNSEEWHHAVRFETSSAGTPTSRRCSSSTARHQQANNSNVSSRLIEELVFAFPERC